MDSSIVTFKFAVGSTVKDKVTGFTGVVIGQTRWLYGCLRYTVQPKELKDGKPLDCVTFDEDALDLIQDVAPTPVKRTGGPNDNPRRAAAPSRR